MRRRISLLVAIVIFAVAWQRLDGAGTPSVSQEPDPAAVPHLTWSQPPLEIDPNADPNVPPVFCAWDEPARSTESSGSKRQWRMDADDFHGLGSVPVTRVRWWGGYKAWNQPEPPALQSVAWHIGFWANQVEGLSGADLFAERLVWAVEIPFERVGFERIGLAEFPDKFPETCFVYEVQLDPNEWFHQDQFASNEGIFWISITAVYPPDAEPANMWGWTTRSQIWGRGAVMPAIMADWPNYDERLFPGRIYPIENASFCGENRPSDMCFELLTEEPWVVWDQPRFGVGEWEVPEFLESFGYRVDEDERIWFLAADDWICGPNTPVAAVTWSGFHAGYTYDPCTCESEEEPELPAYFLLTIWDNVEPTDDVAYDHPGEMLWQYQAYDYDQVASGQAPTFLDTLIFRYSVALPEAEWFRPEDPNGHYWFSVAAIYPYVASSPGYRWCPLGRSRASGAEATSICYIAAGVPRWRPARSGNDARPVDLVFTLFTAP